MLRFLCLPPFYLFIFFYWLIGEGLKNCWNSGGSLIDKEWGFVFWGSCYKWGFFFFFNSTIFSKNIDLNKKLKFFSYIVYRLFNVFFEKYDYTWPGNWSPQYIIYIYSFHHRGILGIIKPYTLTFRRRFARKLFWCATSKQFSSKPSSKS